MIGQLHSEMVRLLRRLMEKFVKTAIITARRDLTSVNFTDRGNQLWVYIHKSTEKTTYLQLSFLVSNLVKKHNKKRFPFNIRMCKNTR